LNRSDVLLSACQLVCWLRMQVLGSPPLSVNPGHFSLLLPSPHILISLFTPHSLHRSEGGATAPPLPSGSHPSATTAAAAYLAHQLPRRSTSATSRSPLGQSDIAPSAVAAAAAGVASTGGSAGLGARQQQGGTAAAPSPPPAAAGVAAGAAAGASLPMTQLCNELQLPATGALQVPAVQPLPPSPLQQQQQQQQPPMPQPLHTTFSLAACVPAGGSSNSSSSSSTSTSSATGSVGVRHQPCTSTSSTSSRWPAPQP